MCVKSLMLNRCFSSALRQNKPSFNPADTNALVAAVGFGKGLSKCRPPGSVPSGHPGQPMMSSGPTLQQVTIAGTTGHQAGMGGQGTQQQPGQPGTTFNDVHKHFYTKSSCIMLLQWFNSTRSIWTGKMPSNIKTNIKSASMHPYNRWASCRNAAFCDTTFGIWSKNAHLFCAFSIK